MLRLIGLIVVLVVGGSAYMGYRACAANPDPAVAAATLAAQTDWPVIGSLVRAGAQLGMAVSCRG